jgi:UMF1 family MFS transporter
MYDWANSAFATIVIAGFFPLFFKEYWNAGVPVTESTFRLGLANSLASLLIVLMAPVLGAVADYLGRRKGMLLLFAAFGIVMTCGLYMVAEGQWLLAAFLYALALVGFSGSNIFYDSLLPFVSDRKDVDKTSALGFSLGYLGGGLLLTLAILMSLYPRSFGLVDTNAAIQLSFVLVAIWWLVFSIPLILYVREPGNHPHEVTTAVFTVGFKRIWETLHEIRRLRNAWVFLLAYWLYIDGVDTIVRMAVDYGLSLGFDKQGLILALLITQFTGFPAALLFGLFGSRYGPKAGIYLALLVYLMVTVWGAMMENVWEFYVLAGFLHRAGSGGDTGPEPVHVRAHDSSGAYGRVFRFL